MSQVTNEQHQEIYGQLLGLVVSSSPSHHHLVPCLPHRMLYQSHLEAPSVNASPNNKGPSKHKAWTLPVCILMTYSLKKLCYKTITWFSPSGPHNASVIVILCKAALTSQSFSKSSISLDPPCKPIILAGQLLSCFHREMRKLRSWLEFSVLAVGRSGIPKYVFLCSPPSCSFLPTTLTFNSGCLCMQLSMFLLTVLLTTF